MELRELLDKHGLIEGLDENQIESLVNIAELVSFTTGDKIISEITRTRDLYILKSGAVSISMVFPTATKKSEVIDSLHAGDLMGEIAFIDGSPRSATVIAEIDTQVYVFPYESLIKLMEDDPRIGYLMIRGIAQILTAKVRETNLAWRNLMMW